VSIWRIHDPGKGERLLFDIFIMEPTLGLASPMRRFLGETLTGALPAETADVVAMAAHELVENAAKYCTDRKATLRVQVEERELGPFIAVVIRNPTTPARIAGLKAAFSEMAAAADPMEYYLEVMQRDLGPGQSGLGLARLRAEGDLEMDLRVLDDVVEISAGKYALPTNPKEASKS
jgi:hypothetical protein